MADLKRNQVFQCRCRVCVSRSYPDEEVLDFHRSINQVMAELDERSRRLFAGLLARQCGRGGMQLLSDITGLSRVTIRRGLRECETAQLGQSERIRRAGGGRKSLEKKVPR